MSTPVSFVFLGKKRSPVKISYGHIKNRKYTNRSEAIRDLIRRPSGQKGMAQDNRACHRSYHVGVRSSYKGARYQDTERAA